MSEYPYCQARNKIKPFFEKIQSIGKPDKVTVKWLTSIGYKSSNDRTILSVLKFINFTDEAGVPTNKWQQYKNKSKSKIVMAQGIQMGYSELFKIYPDANSQGRVELTNFFSEKTEGGSAVVEKMVSTFTELCSLADFGSVGEVSTEDEKTTDTEQKTKKGDTSYSGKGYIININIQLTVPETTDGDVYEKFFAAMKKHLFS